jgi:hypothetical protein
MPPESASTRCQCLAWRGGGSLAPAEAMFFAFVIPFLFVLLLVSPREASTDGSEVDSREAAVYEDAVSGPLQADDVGPARID